MTLSTNDKEVEEMQKRKLGETNLAVSAIGRMHGFEFRLWPGDRPAAKYFAHSRGS